MPTSGDRRAAAAAAQSSGQLRRRHHPARQRGEDEALAARVAVVANRRWRGTTAMELINGDDGQVVVGHRYWEFRLPAGKKTAREAGPELDC